MEISNKINQVHEDNTHYILAQEWKDFYNEKIENWFVLFNKKLCYEEKKNDFFEDKLENQPEESNLNAVEQDNNENQNDEKNLLKNVFIKFF